MRLLPPLWIVCVPLRSVGDLPHPALVPSAPSPWGTSAEGDAAAPRAPLSTVTPAASTRSATAAATALENLCPDITRLLLRFGAAEVDGAHDGPSRPTDDQQVELVWVSRPSRQGRRL